MLKSKPVSRCRGGLCGQQRYDALSRSMEFGIGRFLCPNGKCRRRFFGFCEATDKLQCRKCGSFAKPYIHPKWRKRQRNNSNSRAKSYTPPLQQDNQMPQLKDVSVGGNIDQNMGLVEKLDTGERLNLGEKLNIGEKLNLEEKLNLGEDLSLGESYTCSVGENLETKDDIISQLGSLQLSSSTELTQGAVDNSDAISQCSYSSIASRSTQSSVTSQRSYASVVSQSSTTSTSSNISNRNQLPQRTPRQPKIRSRPRRRIFNASKAHIPVGGTISTFLTQMDFDVGGEEVDLDYDTDDDEGRVGPCKFECSVCEKEYIVFCRMSDTAECFYCTELNRPLSRVSCI